MNEIDNQHNNLVNCLFDTNYGSEIYYLQDPHANLKRYNLLLMMNIAKNNKCSGSVCEFGIFLGYSFSLMMHFFGKEYNYNGYDSFEGLSPPTNDDNLNFPCSHRGNMSVNKNKVLEHLNKICPKNVYNFNLYEGWVNDTIPKKLPNKIAFAHVDMDLFEPTLHTLRHIIPKMEKGGVIVIDDYKDNNWCGIEKCCKIITDEFKVKIHSLNIPVVNGYHKWNCYQGYILF